MTTNRAPFTLIAKFSDGDCGYEHHHVRESALAAFDALRGKSGVERARVTFQDFDGPDCSLRRIAQWQRGEKVDVAA